MLKRKNILKIFMVLVFGFVLFGANLKIFNQASVYAVTETPNFEEESEGSDWSISDETLFLNGVDWIGTLALDGGITTIELSGENKIDGDGNSAIALKVCDVTITGTGTLELGELNQTSDVCLMDYESIGLIIFEGKCTIQKNGSETSELYNSSLSCTDCMEVNYLKFEPSASLGNAKTTESSASVSPVSQTATTVEYNDLDNGVFDISTLFSFTNCDELTKSYYVINGETETLLYNNLYSVTVASYKFKVVVTDASGTEIASSEAELVVEKSAVTITVNHFEWAYGGAPNPLIEGTAPTNAVSFSYYYDAEFNQEVDGIPTEVGTYYVRVVATETTTTLSAETTTTCAIVPKVVAITWISNSFTYNGEVQTITATYKDKDKQDVELNVVIDAQFKNAGTYTATASFKNGETSYVLPETVTKEYTIRPREISVKISNKTIYYSEELLGLTSTVISGSVVGNDNPYEVECDIPDTNPMGEYLIYGVANDENYAITFINGTYLICNKITTLTITSWTYGEEPNAPVIYAHYGLDKVVYTYTSDDGGDYSSTTAPTEPGDYRLTATISDENEYYCATKTSLRFSIVKVVVYEPTQDQSTYIYDGQFKTYKLLGNNDVYSVSGAEQRNAGTYIVTVTLNDTARYRWNRTELASIEYTFTILKKTVEKPVSDNRNFKYTGNKQTYFVQESVDYIISGNIQSEVGHHTVYVSLADTLNTCWADGTSSDMEFDFVIRQSDLTNVNTSNLKGEALETSPVIVTEIGSNGLEPNTKLNVVVIDADDSTYIKQLKKDLSEYLSKYETVFRAYDVTLLVNNIETQPDGNITLKISIPEELLESNFKLYHIHTEENGQKTISQMDLAGAHDLGFVVLQTDELSEFVFVDEQKSLSALIVTFACVSLVLLIALALQLFFYFKPRKNGAKKASTTALAVTPAMFVGSEIAWSIILGVLSVLLLTVNIVFMILLIKKHLKGNKKQKQIVNNDEAENQTDETETKEIKPVKQSKKKSVKSADKESVTKTKNK